MSVAHERSISDLELERDQLVARALEEDLGNLDPASDLTTRWTVPAEATSEANIVAKAPGTISGLEVAGAVFRNLDPSLSLCCPTENGQSVDAGDVILRVRGSTHPILIGERPALNFLQHLSGIATLTRTFVSAIESSPAQITDTRKTIPGLRRLEKQAVVHGGGVNHRLGLFDAVLIKENHAAMAGGVGEAVRKARDRAVEEDVRDTRVYAEARNLDEVDELLGAVPDRILLDNMELGTIEAAVKRIRSTIRGVEIEATGGITLTNVKAFAGTGVDFVSIGALTHSAPALDLSLLLGD
jgi:nicotinate-nucleotide pyrophosphorylase (carboxylating)